MTPIHSFIRFVINNSNNNKQNKRYDHNRVFNYNIINVHIDEIQHCVCKYACVYVSHMCEAAEYQQSRANL